MFAVEMLPDGHGDALVVEYGTRTDPHQLLVDVGPFHSWDGVRRELPRRRRDRYEVFVVTHVDEDHIGGAIALLDDPISNIGSTICGSTASYIAGARQRARPNQR
jgi:beta-lactamase superfamily II metal-dependent hydrolase